ncbi:restriction endonuclease [Rhodococcus sp. HNM0569]|uniref:restriction endonuclease n=1 Tax=Rhodococcus sp. HNM0569 TaxID=2716340 RepID=UPI00146CF325|nr:restriction endonuclease [Rhodococcus sp. HNM0569]NLU83829.1 restriction endonuclease [Rhodococcus sp. HNM0569]
MLVGMTATVPQYVDLLWPALQTAIALGGSASNDELDSAVIEREALSSEVQAVLHGDGPSTEIEYRLAWARTYLKGMGLLTNSRRGVWSVTEKGREVTEKDIRPLHAEFSAENRKKNAARKSARAASRRAASAEDTPVEEPDAAIAEAENDVDWKDRLLETVLKMSPDAFERLIQRLLREAGFSSASVTGRNADGDVEGLGLYQVSLLSFPVFFQCRRYSGSVEARAVRDFRGAMSGRGEKGLLITTGTFTGDARAEAKRDGAPPIDLIDGDRLCELFKEHSLGVTTRTRVVEDVEIETEYFTSLEPK